MESCPDCLSEVPEGAVVCSSCGERMTGRRCTACGARNWEEARLCRWCGTSFEPTGHGLEFEEFTVTARRLPTFLFRGRLLPRSLVITREKILVRTPGVFDLTQGEEEIPWAKVAGFDYHSGLLWDRVRIETRGQSSSTFGCLAKEDGERIRALLRELEI